jgi:hypothetical protein
MLALLRLAMLGCSLNAAPADSPAIHVAAHQSVTPGRSEPVVETLPEAIDQLRHRRLAGDAAPARIIIHDGRHVLTDPIIIDPDLAGEGLCISAAEGAAPVISGGRLITGLQPQPDGTWRTVIDDVRKGDWWFEEVFIDFEPRPRARHPNTGYARIVAAGPDNRTSFTIDPTEIPIDQLDSRAEVVLLHDWSTSRIPITHADIATNTITTAHPIGCKAPHYAITNFEPHPRFFIEGSPALLDAPGEWALDRATGAFIYMPRPGEDTDTVQLIAPAATGLIRIAGTAENPITNVFISGLRFAHVNWPIPPHGYAEGQAAFHEQRDDPTDTGIRRTVPAAIEFAWANRCRIESCHISSVGGSGVRIGEGCRCCVITDSTVRDAGANGIMIGEAASRSVDSALWWKAAPHQAASGNRVEHCLVERCGRRFFGAVGVWIGLAEKTTIARCEIRDLPYTGVSVGWRWDETPTPCRENLIEANHIHHVMQVLSDGGGIYTLGLQPGTVLRSNAIHDIHRNAGRAPSNGIFFDQGTTDLLVEGNVFWGIDTTPIRWHWTYANTVRDNTFVLREGQMIARYNRAKAEDITYEEQPYTAGIGVVARRGRTDHARGGAGNPYTRLINMHLLTLLCIAVSLSGCSLGESGVQSGTPITRIIEQYGEPDVISERSGDLIRYYTPEQPVEYAWPAEAPKTLYYLDRDIAIKFVLGSAKKVEKITPDERKRLVDLLKR